jgi:hypothetical protein
MREGAERTLLGKFSFCCSHMPQTWHAPSGENLIIGSLKTVTPFQDKP